MVKVDSRSAYWAETFYEKERLSYIKVTGMLVVKWESNRWRRDQSEKGLVWLSKDTMLEQFDRAVFIVDQLSTSAKSPGRIRLRKVLGGLINEVGGGGGGGVNNRTVSKRQRFKTSCIAVRIKILFNFTRSFKLQNVVKNDFISIQARIRFW